MIRQTIELLGVNVDIINPNKACERIAQWILEKKKSYVCVAPVSTLVDCQKDQLYKDIVNQASMVTPDGMPVVWLARSKGAKQIERTYGPDLLLKLTDVGQSKGWRHFFYGATQETCDLLERRLKYLFTDVNIVGKIVPPFKTKAEKESEDILFQINKADPDILWIALGSPKQDYWMYHNRPYLNASVLVGVGAAFDFISGLKPQAPQWMRNSGLEWLFRLCCEPKRLWRRYLIGNALFVFYILKDLLRKNK